MAQLELEAPALADRLRSRVALVQTRVAELPVQVRAAAVRLLDRVRTALDIPSRTELAELTARLEELDRRIGALSTERASVEPAPVVEVVEAIAAPAPAPEPVVEAPAPAPAPV